MDLGVNSFNTGLAFRRDENRFLPWVSQPNKNNTNLKLLSALITCVLYNIIKMESECMHQVEGLYLSVDLGMRCGSSAANFVVRGSGGLFRVQPSYRTLHVRTNCGRESSQLIIFPSTSVCMHAVLTDFLDIHCMSNLVSYMRITHSRQTYWTY